MRFFFKNQKETQRNNFGDIIKGYFCSGKFCFERTRLENAKKKRNQKGEEKLKEFQERDEKKEMKKDTHRNMKVVQKKGREKIVFCEKRCTKHISCFFLQERLIRRTQTILYFRFFVDFFLKKNERRETRKIYIEK